MAIRFDTVGNPCAQIKADAPSCADVLSRLIARIATFDDSIDVVAVGDLKERPVKLWCSR
jgi:hypothetical protein